MATAKLISMAIFISDTTALYPELIILEGAPVYVQNDRLRGNPRTSVGIDQEAR